MDGKIHWCDEEQTEKGAKEVTEESKVSKKMVKIQFKVSEDTYKKYRSKCSKEAVIWNKKLELYMEEFIKEE